MKNKYLFSYWFKTSAGQTGISNVVVETHGDATLDTYLRVQTSIERDLQDKTGANYAKVQVIAFSKFGSEK